MSNDDWAYGAIGLLIGIVIGALAGGVMVSSGVSRAQARTNELCVLMALKADGHDPDELAQWIGELNADDYSVADLVACAAFLPMGDRE